MANCWIKNSWSICATCAHGTLLPSTSAESRSAPGPVRFEGEHDEPRRLDFMRMSAVDGMDEWTLPASLNDGRRCGLAPSANWMARLQDPGLHFPNLLRMPGAVQRNHQHPLVGVEWTEKWMSDR